MPQYYNPGLFPATYASPVYNNNGYYYPQQPMQMSGQPQPITYMYQVDGESAARGWNPPNGQLPPNAVVPLFDADGYHIYFKTTDAYGRINPIRKGYVVFEEEKQQQPLPQGQSEDTPPVTTQDMSQYVTKDDLNAMRQEIMNALSQNNQNGRKNVPPNGQQGYNKGGDNR